MGFLSVILLFTWASTSMGYPGLYLPPPAVVVAPRLIPVIHHQIVPSGSISRTYPTLTTSSRHILFQQRFGRKLNCSNLLTTVEAEMGSSTTPASPTFDIKARFAEGNDDIQAETTTLKPVEEVTVADDMTTPTSEEEVTTVQPEESFMESSTELSEQTENVATDMTESTTSVDLDTEIEFSTDTTEAAFDHTESDGPAYEIPMESSGEHVFDMPIESSGEPVVSMESSGEPVMPMESSGEPVLPMESSEPMIQEESSVDGESIESARPIQEPTNEEQSENIDPIIPDGRQEVFMENPEINEVLGDIQMFEQIPDVQSRASFSDDAIESEDMIQEIMPEQEMESAPEAINNQEIINVQELNGAQIINEQEDLQTSDIDTEKVVEDIPAIPTQSPVVVPEFIKPLTSLSGYSTAFFHRFAQPPFLQHPIPVQHGATNNEHQLPLIKSYQPVLQSAAYRAALHPLPLFKKTTTTTTVEQHHHPQHFIHTSDGIALNYGAEW